MQRMQLTYPYKIFFGSSEGEIWCAYKKKNPSQELYADIKIDLSFKSVGESESIRLFKIICQNIWRFDCLSRVKISTSKMVSRFKGAILKITRLTWSLFSLLIVLKYKYL